MRARRTAAARLASVAPAPNLHSMVVPARGRGDGALHLPVPRPLPMDRQVTASDALVHVLAELGITHAFGLTGGAIAPFARALQRSPIEFLHFRHEAGAAFAATEASLATGRPVVVLATTGPGITNALTGLLAARWEGAKVLLISAATPSAQRGRWAFQETSSYTTSDGAMLSRGGVFHYSVTVESVAEVPVVASRLASGFARPGGFVAHLSVPTDLQNARLDGPLVSPRVSSRPPGCDAASSGEWAARLSAGPLVLWVGFGARGAAPAVRALAERSGAGVICSPRGKGIFPETHPQFLGVTGLGGDAEVEAHLSEHPPAHVLVLGSRLGESTSYYRKELVPTEGFVHVDVDPEVFGAAYPGATTFGIQAEIGAFLGALAEDWPEEGVARYPLPESPPRREPLEPRAGGPVRPRALMRAIQRNVVRDGSAVVMSEAGNAFVWATHELRFDSPGRYRVSSGFGSMGHATTGVVGVAAATGRKAVAIVGDGSMLMQSEVSTAAYHRLPAVWIVLNDARYGMIDQGMRSLGWSPFGVEIPPADFVMIARGMGADGVRVENEAELDEALHLAMAATGPFVVDVHIDPTELAPAARRNQTLTEQWGKPPKDGAS